MFQNLMQPSSFSADVFDFQENEILSSNQQHLAHTLNFMTSEAVFINRFIKLLYLTFFFNTNTILIGP